jgi:hypothetical protein
MLAFTPQICLSRKSHIAEIKAAQRDIPSNSNRAKFARKAATATNKDALDNHHV